MPGPGTYDQDLLSMDKGARHKIIGNAASIEELQHIRKSNYQHYKALKQRMNLEARMH